MTRTQNSGTALARLPNCTGSPRQPCSVQTYSQEQLPVCKHRWLFCSELALAEASKLARRCRSRALSLLTLAPLKPVKAKVSSFSAGRRIHINVRATNVSAAHRAKRKQKVGS